MGQLNIFDLDLFDSVGANGAEKIEVLRVYTDRTEYYFTGAIVAGRFIAELSGAPVEETTAAVNLMLKPISVFKNAKFGKWTAEIVKTTAGEIIRHAAETFSGGKFEIYTTSQKLTAKSKAGALELARAVREDKKLSRSVFRFVSDHCIINI